MRLLNEIKNLYGWTTKRKILVISVDDYGNVRLSNKEARNNLTKHGIKIRNRFDAFDSMETREDLEMLYEVLSSVKDKNGNHAKLTPFVVPCNINFEKIIESEFKNYYFEKLPDTFAKLATTDPLNYEDAWSLWNQGIKNKLLYPQFHGREHLNLQLFNQLLKTGNKSLKQCIVNRSFTSLESVNQPTINLMAAFDFFESSRNIFFEDIITDGLNKFEEIFGFRSIHFNPPAGRENPLIHNFLYQNGIRFIDTPLIKSEHQGMGKFKKVINYTGKSNKLGMIYIVRNVVFEPTHDRGFEWVSYAFSQVESAFRWNKPAIVSSHRVNFCGHIDPKNREVGLNALRILLKKVVNRWPDVEFFFAHDLGELIEERRNTKSNSD